MSLQSLQSLDISQSKGYEGECISPKHLLDASTDSPMFHQTHDIGNLQPGCQFKLFYNPLPTPQSVLDGTYRMRVEKSLGHQDIVIIVPRLPRYLEKPFLPSITFSCRDGKPGPHIIDLLQGKVKLDRASDLVFMNHGWRQTRLTIDWPGKQLHATCIPCIDKRGHPLTRKDVARLVSVSVWEIVRDGKDGRLCKWGSQVINDPALQRWNLETLNCDKVRLMALNYYRMTWVAVLAVDDPNISDEILMR